MRGTVHFRHQTAAIMAGTSLLQPQYLRDGLVSLSPLRTEDHDLLYSVASDPLIWEQHPNPDRYRPDVFANFFRGAIESGGALLIRDTTSGSALGSSRFYDHDPQQGEIKIGYTFFTRSVWGKGHNPATKRLMLDHAFTFVDRVIFHVGVHNRRSRIAMERLGAVNDGELDVAYYGEPSRTNVVYRIDRETWQRAGSVKG